ncbi:MAG: hypothetical protein ACE14V_15245 [bacterium]
MKKSKKIIWTIILILVLLGLIILIWWYYPVTRIDTNQLIPQNVSISIRCLTDSQHQLRQTGIQLFSRNAGQQVSGLKGKLVQLGISKAFPEEIKVAINQKPDSKENSIILVVDFGPGIKLVRLVQDSLTQKLLHSSRILDKPAGPYTIRYILRSGKQVDSQPQACAWIDSGLIISNDLNLLTDLVSKYRSKSAISVPSGQPDCVFSISNKNQEITEWIKEQEKQLEYAIFPTIGNIDRIEGTLTMQHADAGSGTIVFYINPSIAHEKLPEINADVEFFKNVLRRLVRAHDLDLTASVSTQNNSIQVDYQVTGLSNVKF